MVGERPNFHWRPSEAFRIRVQDVLRPTQGTRHGNWTIVMHPLERLRPPEVMACDETVVFDLDEFRFLRHGLAVLMATRSPTMTLVDFT